MDCRIIQSDTVFAVFITKPTFPLTKSEKSHNKTKKQSEFISLKQCFRFNTSWALLTHLWLSITVENHCDSKLLQCTSNASNPACAREIWKPYLLFELRFCARHASPKYFLWVPVKSLSDIFANVPMFFDILWSWHWNCIIHLHRQCS